MVMSDPGDGYVSAPFLYWMMTQWSWNRYVEKEMITQNCWCRHDETELLTKSWWHIDVEPKDDDT